MPRVSAFYGVLIYMYWNERDNPVAHFHARYAGHRASGLGGWNRTCWQPGAPGSSSRPGWASLRHEEILENWERARRNEPLLGIPPRRSMMSMGAKYLPVVTGVAVIRDRVLRLLFSDGTVGDVDFSAERWTGVLEPLNDPAYFAQVTVDTEAGTVAWPNGIDLAPEPLYEQAHTHPLVAA